MLAELPCCWNLHNLDMLRLLLKCNKISEPALLHRPRYSDTVNKGTKCQLESNLGTNGRHSTWSAQASRIDSHVHAQWGRIPMEIEDRTIEDHAVILCFLVSGPGPVLRQTTKASASRAQLWRQTPRRQQTDRRIPALESPRAVLDLRPSLACLRRAL